MEHVPAKWKDLRITFGCFFGENYHLYASSVKVMIAKQSEGSDKKAQVWSDPVL